jgi:hypothetical protein
MAMESPMLEALATMEGEPEALAAAVVVAVGAEAVECKELQGT